MIGIIFTYLDTICWKMEFSMKMCQSVDEKKLFVKDMTSLISKSLINLGEKKSQLPWFVSSSSYIQLDSKSIRKAS
jgi:hypothetical protein